MTHEERYADQWRRIYIDGVERWATKSRLPDLQADFDGVFFVDSPELPLKRCSQHRMSSGATSHLESGGRVKSLGSWYSLKQETTGELK